MPIIGRRSCWAKNPLPLSHGYRAARSCFSSWRARVRACVRLSMVVSTPNPPPHPSPVHPVPTVRARGGGSRSRRCTTARSVAATLPKIAFAMTPGKCARAPCRSAPIGTPSLPRDAAIGQSASQAYARAEKSGLQGHGVGNVRKCAFSSGVFCQCYDHHHYCYHDHLGMSARTRRSYQSNASTDF